MSNGQELREVGRFLQTRMRPGQEVYFLAREEHHSRPLQEIKITSTIVEYMIMHGQLRLPEVGIDLSSKLVMIEISLFLGTGDLCPISRFPRSLLEDERPIQGKFVPRNFVSFLTAAKPLTCLYRLAQKSKIKLWSLGWQNAKSKPTPKKVDAPRPQRSSPTLSNNLEVFSEGLCDWRLVTWPVTKNCCSA